MNTRFQKIVLGLLVVLSACLTGLWLQARNTGKTLQAALTTAQATANEAIRSSAEENNRITALNAEISERQKALGNTPEAQETKRRAAALVVIDQLKLAHQKTPPAPRQKPPPSGPSGGPFLFPELLSDPEYNQLYAQQNLRMTRYIEGRKLRELGLSPDAFEKVISILAEKQMSLTDYRQIAGNARSSGDFAKQLNEASDKALKEIMGEETFSRWEAANTPKMTSHESLASQAKQYLSKLSIRLSYTDTPLAAEQTGHLAELMATLSGSSKTQIYRMLYDDAFTQQSAAILSPPQVEALRQFKAEQDASVKRSKLPKSSELPRNTLPAK